MKEFKAESKKLLDLMINSIYTNKEIFLRELISNASDAIDKIYYKALTDESIKFNREDFYIKIKADEEKRTLTVSDTGIGMTEEELENNLGIIAKSGSLDFKQELEMNSSIDIIGQFGVGFYSAFMVSKKVTVISKAFGADKAYKWESSGVEGFTISEAEKDTVGTDVIMEIKDNTDEENYDEFIKEYGLRDIIKKYSDYIRYPIKMGVTKSRIVEEGEEEKVESYVEEETLNSMVPIWRKNRSELKEEDYIEYYKDRHFGFDKPLKYIHMNVDGTLSFKAILYLPETPPFDFYTREYEKGLELYSSGVLIMQKCSDLLPDYFSFVKGVVDSEDISLNISREVLQHTRELKAIAKKIEDRIKQELENMLQNDREAYEKFFESFGKQLKFGVYQNFGMNKSTLQDLLLFYSGKEKKQLSFKEYKENMKEGQKYIYYATGDSNDSIDKLPQTELVRSKDFDILYLTDEVDEFSIKVINEYDGVEFRSVSSDDLGIEEDEEKKEEIEKVTKENEGLFKDMKEILGDKVTSVIPSKKLTSSPVCLSSEGEISIEMEKILSHMPNNEQVKAKKILEINPNHKVFDTLKDAEKNDKDKLKLLTGILFDQARLIEGLPIEDPVKYTNDVVELMNR